MPLLAHKPIQDKFVLAAHIQVGDKGRALGTLHRHCLRLIPVLVLDHEGIELAFRDRPVQEQGVGGHICHCQLTQAWWCRGLPRLFQIPVWSGGWGWARAKAKQEDSAIALSSSPFLPSTHWLPPAWTAQSLPQRLYFPTPQPFVTSLPGKGTFPLLASVLELEISLFLCDSFPTPHKVLSLSPHQGL